MSDELEEVSPTSEPKSEERKPKRRRRRPRAKAPVSTSPQTDEPDSESAEGPSLSSVDDKSKAYAEQVSKWREESQKSLVPLKIPEALISNDALRIVEKLNDLGHLSYVVGGCVRDLALGTEPKDFDVVTTARPQQVRRAFRYARIIGRRFRLVHVRFGRHRLIEVATFRAQVPEAEEGDDLLVRDDNIYGSPVEDAQRRDFTVNGLFYDPISGSVVDYVDGIKDLRRKLIRSIGPADKRIQEDPVRILRALRFAAKLGFELDKQLEKAIRKHGADILRCSPARLWEELLKIMRSGHCAHALSRAQKLGFLEHLLPEVSAAMKERPADYKALLEALDALVIERGQAPDELVLLAALVLPLVPSEQPRQQVDQLMRLWNDRFRVPKRLRERLEDSLLAVRAMVPDGPWVEKDALARRSLFGDSIDILDLLMRASGAGRGLVKDWRLLQRPQEEQDA
jgi:poly(A) polymerase